MKNYSTAKSSFFGKDLKGSSLAGKYGISRKTPAKSTH